MKNRTQWSSMLLAAGLAVTLAACGTTPFTPDTQFGDFVTVVVVNEALPQMAAGATQVLPLTTAREGSLEVTVTWLDQRNDVQAILTEAGCRGLQFLGTADCVRSAESRQRKNDRDQATYRERAGEYRLWIVNRGPNSDTVTVTAQLTYQEASTKPASPEPRDPPRQRDPAVR